MNPTPDRPQIVLIAALSADHRRVIGRNADLLWQLSSDIKHFKHLTMGHCIVMGRKTLDSLPPRWKPLPGRHNIVVTRRPDFNPESGIVVKHSIEEAISYALKHCPPDMDPDKIYVIGGGEIYAQALPYADRLELTLIEDTATEGNIHFPDYRAEGFTIEAAEARAQREVCQKSGKEFSFTFHTLVRDPEHPKKRLEVTAEK